MLASLEKLALFIEPIFYKLLFMSITAAMAGVVILLVRRFADKRISPI